MTEHADQTWPAPHDWICDICGDKISTPGVGHVIWRESDERPAHDFKIVHTSMDGRRCWTIAEQAGYRSSLPLEEFLGADGVALLLSWLSWGPVDGGGHPDVALQDLDDYVDLFRRLQTPYYEQARHRFREPDVHESLVGVNPQYPYLPSTLAKVVSQPGLA